MKKVTIVGVGALGSHVAQFLRNDAELKVIDFDRIEQKNVAAQFHGKASVGKNKAEALKQTMAFLFGTKIEAVPHKLTKDNQAQLLDGADLIIDCLDNAESRRLVQDFAIRYANPVTAELYVACLHGALAAGGNYGRAVWTEHFVPDEAVADAPTCEGGEHLVFCTLAASVIAFAAREFLRTGKKLNFTITESSVRRI